MVAIAASAAVAIGSGQQIAIQRSASFLNSGQAWEYVVGAERFARQVLRRDREDNSIDHLGEDWSTLVPPTVVDGGDLFGRLEDLQARFNLNNLVDGNGVSEPDIAQFQRLLQQLDIPAQQAWNVVDWLDGDQDPSPGRGAEDLDYLRRSPAYRSAGRPLTSPSELLLIEGFDMASYLRLEPHIAAIPGRVPLNINTASPELIQTLADEINPGIAEQLVDERGDEGYESPAAFLAKVAELAGDDARERAGSAALSTGSNHFLFTGEARFGRGRVVLASHLERAPNGQTTARRRSRGVL